MMHTNIQQHFQKGTNKKVQLKINDNRSTMLSVRWEPDCTKISMHKIFLKAPQNVMEALTCYVKRKQPQMPAPIREFIETHLHKLDYSHTLDHRKLYCQGTCYNLKDVYDSLNQEYFDNKLNLTITWYGKAHQRNRSRVTFGLYHDPLKLIKINRLLDSPSYPDYLISYVVYHEMLHEVCPSYFDENGVHRIHNKEFKALEMNYRHYSVALEWIKNNQDHFFNLV